MRIVAMSRVKNEARWIEKCIGSPAPICSDVFVMDDHSTDNTAELCRNSGANVFSSPFQSMDEARDKDWLLERVWERVHESAWVICIDGDEALHPADKDVLLNELELRRYYSFNLKIVYLGLTSKQFVPMASSEDLHVLV